MFDAFTKVVAQADARGEFLSPGQIDALAAMVAESNKRMDTVNRITSNASKIVTNAARDLFEAQPALIAPGGNAYTHRRMAACLRPRRPRRFRGRRRAQDEGRCPRHRQRSQRHHPRRLLRSDERSGHLLRPRCCRCRLRPSRLIGC